MSEETLDIRRVLGLLRRRRSIVAVCVLVGALIPTVWTLWHPAPYSAKTLVLVPSSASSGSSGTSNGSPAADSNTTDSEIAVSSAVLGAAGSKVTPRLSVQTAAKRVTATPVAANLVQISASGSSPSAAQALANAVAGQLVAFVTSSQVSSGSSALSGLEAQASALTKQVNQYDQEIQSVQAGVASYGQTSVEGQQDLQLLGSLTTAEADASLQLQSVNSQIAAAKLGAAANGGTQVIQEAVSATRPSLLSQLLPIVVGAILGLLIGSALVVIIWRRGSNVTTRDEIAEVAGVPVVLSLNVGRSKRTSEWLTLLREHNPAVTEVWNVRKALRHLDLLETRRRELTIVTLADDSASVGAVAHFAVVCATMEIPTSLVLTSDDPGSRRIERRMRFPYLPTRTGATKSSAFQGVTSGR